MKTKRILALILAVLTLCTLTACNKNTNEDNSTPVNVEETDTDIQETDIEKIETEEVEVIDFSNYTEKELTRWYPEYTDHLIPSEEYGELVPFLGGKYEYPNPFYQEGVDDPKYAITKEPLYGLCTKDGKIVVDAVYSRIEYNEGYYMLTSKPDEESMSTLYLAKSDGSTLTEFSRKYRALRYAGYGIYEVCNLYDAEDASYYDKEGNLLYTNGDGYFTVVDENIFTIREEGKMYLTNNKMEKLTDDYEELDYLANGRYIAKDIQTGVVSIYDLNDNNSVIRSGIEYYDIIAPILGDGIFVITENKTATVMNDDMKVISEFDIEGEFDYTWGNISFSSPIILRTGDTTYYDIYGNKIDYDYVDYDTNNYCAYKDGVTTILDTDFKVVGTLEGKYYQLGYNDEKDKMNLVLENRNNGEYFVYDLELKKIIGKKSTHDNDKSVIEFVKNGEKFVSSKDSEVFANKVAEEEMKFFEHNGYFYSLNEKNEVIFKTKIDE